MSKNKPALLNPSEPVVDADGKMSERLRYWSQLVTENQIIVGTGSPEGVVSASQYTLYIDETNPLVPVQYRKMLSSLTGDRLNGWVQL